MKHSASLLLVVFALCRIQVDGQVLPEYELGGASKPRPDMKFRAEDQYKRVHQTALRFILRDELVKTEEFLKSFVGQHPDDAETLYMLGILNGRKGDLETAESYLKQAIVAGLPRGRLVAGPREVSRPLLNLKTVREAFRHFSTRPVHGPLLGNVTDRSAAFWVRTHAETDVQVMLSASPTFESPVYTDVAASVESEDYTVVAEASSLQPDTRYYYAVRIGNGPWNLSETQVFRTTPGVGEPDRFTIAFGGGAGYVPENERMWDTIRDCNPDAILLLGDNVYIDDPESVTMQQYTYQRRQSRPEWRRLTAGSPVYTIWDDHDFSTNDSWGGADVDVPFWKRDWVFPIFRQNWVNPGYGGGDQLPGCWYSFTIGDVDFVMLDCRYYRTEPRGEHRSMLGSEQMAWLKNELIQSQGRLKILCSSVPWDFRTKGDSRDTWNGYREEHEEILSFVESNRLEGVILMSADRHRSDAWKIERSNGYGFYEFNSSRLTNQHVHPTMEKKGAIFSYNATQSFGLVTFDTTKNDPEVLYEVVDIDGRKPHSLTVKLSELEF